MLKSNELASAVSHAENCLYDIKKEIDKNGSEDQKHYMARALHNLEWLYFALQEEE